MSSGVFLRAKLVFWSYHAFAVSRERFPDVQGPDGVLHVALDVTDTVSPPRLLYGSAMQSLSEQSHNENWDENKVENTLFTKGSCTSSRLLSQNKTKRGDQDPDVKWRDLASHRRGLFYANNHIIPLITWLLPK